MEPSAYPVVAGILLTISVLGGTANSLVIVLFVRSKKLWTRQNILILTLACADFLMAVGGLMPPLISAFHRHWVFSELGCQIEAFVCSFVGIGTKAILVLLAVERLRIVRSRNQRAKAEHKHPALYILSVWLFAFAVTSPPLFGWGRYSIEGSGVSCSVDWESTTLNSLSYIAFLFMVGFLIPLIIIISAYVGVCVTLHQAKKFQSLSCVSKAESRVTLMVAVMVIAFLVAWVPYAVMAILKMVAALRGQSSPVADMRSITAYLPALLAKSSIIYNPVIYAVCNTQFRGAWREMFRFPKPSTEGDDPRNIKVISSKKNPSPKRLRTR